MFLLFYSFFFCQFLSARQALNRYPNKAYIRRDFHALFRSSSRLISHFKSKACAFSLAMNYALSLQWSFTEASGLTMEFNEIMIVSPFEWTAFLREYVILGSSFRWNETPTKLRIRHMTHRVWYVILWMLLTSTWELARARSETESYRPVSLYSIRLLHSFLVFFLLAFPGKHIIFSKFNDDHNRRHTYTHICLRVFAYLPFICAWVKYKCRTRLKMNSLSAIVSHEFI